MSSGTMRGCAWRYPQGSSHGASGPGDTNPGQRSSWASRTAGSTGPESGGTRMCPPLQRAC
eukprot:5631629-Alexandrium_andersonii.AAC.1